MGWARAVYWLVLKRLAWVILELMLEFPWRGELVGPRKALKLCKRGEIIVRILMCPLNTAWGY